MRRPSLFALAVAVLAAAIFSKPASCDSFTASYLAAGVQTPSATNNVNTFGGLTYVPYLNYTTFNSTSFSGSYAGNFSLPAADQFGGADGSGNYISTTSSYTLTINTPVNYFGLWFSALDGGNQLQFYRDSVLLYTFTPATYQSLVGACPSSSNAFCGNPTTKFKGQDSGEQFAYLNFVDTDGMFNKITFTQTTSGGAFESDNHAVAILNNPTGNGQLGTAIVTPEPSSWILALTGLGAIATVMAMRRSATV